MFLFSPEKLLVVLVVALVVLGPDKLPHAARQVSATWNAITSLRARLEAEARSAFPELPSFDAVAQAVRSPLSYLDGLVPEAGSTSDPVPVPGAPPDASTPTDMPRRVDLVGVKGPVPLAEATDGSELD